MISLKGKNCLIMGATGGIGRFVAREMAKEKCNLYLMGRNRNKLSKLSKSIFKKYKTNVNFLTMDFTDEFIFNTNMEKITNNIDIFINCVGIYLHKPIMKCQYYDYSNIFDINVEKPIKLCQKVIPNMIKKRWGRIINIGSIASYQGFPNNTLYCASKHAILGFTRALRGELKEHNIRVYCISPSATKTKMGKQIPNQNYETFLNPKEVAEYITFVIKYDKELISEEIRLNRFIM